MRVFREESGRIRWTTRSEIEPDDIEPGISSFVHPGLVVPPDGGAPRPIDVEADWSPRPGEVEPMPAGGIPTDIATAKLEARLDLAAVRYGYEVGGVAFTIDSGPGPRGTFTVHTDRQSYAMISGTLQSFTESDTDAFVDWKMAEGFVRMDRTLFSRMAFAVYLHVRRCFGAESTVADLIEAADDLSGFDVAAEYQAAFEETAQ